MLVLLTSIAMSSPELTIQSRNQMFPCFAEGIFLVFIDVHITQTKIEDKILHSQGTDQEHLLWFRDS